MIRRPAGLGHGPRLALVALLLCFAAASRAQLANSFYNVTGIQTRVLPNAVQVTIRTDGTVSFGGDESDFMLPDESQWGPRPTTSFRLRLLRARARLPAFVDIGSYPVDSAVVSLGTDEFVRPYFRGGDYDQPEPRVDITLRFYVPVHVQRFIVDRRAYDSYDGVRERGLFFNDILAPRDVEVKIGDDRRSIVITVISDRADAGKAGTIKRSPVEEQNHHCNVTAVAGTTGAFRVDALHTPLSELLAAYSTAAKMPMVAREDALAVDVSLLLPSAKPQEFLKALTVGYGLAVLDRPPEEGGGWSVGRNGPSSQTERIPLHYLAPENARLLFPDFLLSQLRADSENNALVASGSPELLARLRRDVARLDQPRPQVKVEATVWEFATTDDALEAARLAGVIGRTGASLDSDTGELSVIANRDQRASFTAAIDALQAKGRVRLLAKPNVVVVSGAQGTLFFGQQRYLTVLRQEWWGQSVEALKLQVGYSLTVIPTIGASDDITLDLTPRVSTVDDVEQGTGLPTLGIREARTVMRVRSGDAIFIAGLDSRMESSERRHTPFAGSPFGSRRSNKSQTATIVMVTASKQ